LKRSASGTKCEFAKGIIGELENVWPLVPYEIPSRLEQEERLNTTPVDC